MRRTFNQKSRFSTGFFSVGGGGSFFNLPPPGYALGLRSSNNQLPVFRLQKLTFFRWNLFLASRCRDERLLTSFFQKFFGCFQICISFTCFNSHINILFIAASILAGTGSIINNRYMKTSHVDITELSDANRITQNYLRSF